MWHLLFDFLLFTFGTIFGVVLMCIFQVAKRADRDLEKMNWRNEE